MKTYCKVPFHDPYEGPECPICAQERDQFRRAVKFLGLVLAVVLPAVAVIVWAIIKAMS